MPYFHKAKIGEKIFVWTKMMFSQTDRFQLIVNNKGIDNAILIPATVVDQNPSMCDTLLGWKAGEVIPFVYESFIASNLNQETKDNGIIIVHRYGNHCSYELTDGSIPVGRQEKPCYQCKRMNDLGVNSCWLCGSLDPTK